jgi:hypothetical protein
MNDIIAFVFDDMFVQIKHSNSFFVGVLLTQCAFGELCTVDTVLKLNCILYLYKVDIEETLPCGEHEVSLFFRLNHDIQKLL